MDLLLLSPLFLAPEPLARPQPCGLSAPAVSETALGWEVRLATPGLSHKDVSVELVQKPNQLFLRLQGAEGAFKHVLRLPPKVEAAGVSATVTHGLLRVSLPKVQEIEVLPRDAKPADGSAAGGEHADEATVTLAVPGISHAEVKVSVVDDKLTIAADSKHGWGKHSEIFRLPPLAAVKSIRASCEHGVVTVRVPITPETRHKIAVGSDLSLLRLENGNKSAHNDNGTPSGGKQLQAAQQQELPLIQVGVPGFSSADFSAEVVGRTLHIHGVHEDGSGEAACRRAVRRSVLLPAGTPAEAVHVACADGLLRAWMPRAALPPEERVIAVAVTAAAAASQPATPPPSPAAAAAGSVSTPPPPPSGTVADDSAAQ